MTVPMRLTLATARKCSTWNHAIADVRRVQTLPQQALLTARFGHGHTLQNFLEMGGSMVVQDIHLARPMAICTATKIIPLT